MKPPALCQSHSDPRTQLDWEAQHFAVDMEKRGLRCRQATTTRDAYYLYKFFETVWPEYGIDLPTLARILRYGYVLLVEEMASDRIIAAQLADHYADQTVQALRYAVDPLHRRAGLGAQVVLQHAVDCWRRGGRVRRGFVDLANADALASLTNLLNHVGCVVDGCETYLWGEGRTVLTVELQLTPLDLVASRIDQAAAKEWMLSASPHEYTLLSPSAPARIAEVYRTSRHRIVGVLAGGALLAVPMP
jgi:GNAT superfamily N-acetyltransferase